MACAPFSMLGGPSDTGYNEVHFLVHGGWDSRDVSVTSMCDYVKECMSVVMYLIIYYVGCRLLL